MSGVGGVPFNIIRGVPQQLKELLDIWHTAGVDGTGAQSIGYGGVEFELTGIAYCANNDAANACIAASNALQGFVVAVEDDFGDEYPDLLVTEVDSLNSKMPLIYQGNANAVRVQIRFRMIAS